MYEVHARWCYVHRDGLAEYLYYYTYFFTSDQSRYVVLYLVLHLCVSEALGVQISGTVCPLWCSTIEKRWKCKYMRVRRYQTVCLCVYVCARPHVCG